MPAAGTERMLGEGARNGVFAREMQGEGETGLRGPVGRNADASWRRTSNQTEAVGHMGVQPSVPRLVEREAAVGRDRSAQQSRNADGGRCLLLLRLASAAAVEGSGDALLGEELNRGEYWTGGNRSRSACDWAQRLLLLLGVGAGGDVWPRAEGDIARRRACPGMGGCHGQPPFLPRRWGGRVCRLVV